MAAPIKDVFVNHEGLIFRRGRIYPESFVMPLYAAPYKRPSTYGRFLVKNYWLRRGAIRVPSGLWVIDNVSVGNYHHWLIDCLPRVLRAEGLYPDERVLLLPRCFRQQPYVPFTLRAFPRIDRVGWIGARSKVRVTQVARVPRPPPFVYRADELAEVAHRVGVLAANPGTARRIYFSRADARRRRAHNEAELVRVLRAHDFEIIRIDPDKPWEQIRASRGASFIVGVHGAALSNVIFMPPGGRLLELRHGRADVFLDAYRPLAEAMGVDYRRQLCEPANDVPPYAPATGGPSAFQCQFGAISDEPPTARLRPAVDPLYAINDMDLVVDLDLLRENLR